MFATDQKQAYHPGQIAEAGGLLSEVDGEFVIEILDPVAGQVLLRNLPDLRSADRYPELREAYSMDIDGEPVIEYTLVGSFSRGAPYLGSSSNVGWADFLKQQVPWLIDVAVNCIFFDAPVVSGYGVDEGPIARGGESTNCDTQLRLPIMGWGAGSSLGWRRHGSRGGCGERRA
jgi:hypothetical protein